MTSRKQFEVRFWVTDAYHMVVKARNEDEAIARAKARYARYGEDPEHGIHLDICEGGVGEDWEASEVAP